MVNLLTVKANHQFNFKKGHVSLEDMEIFKEFVNKNSVKLLATSSVHATVSVFGNFCPKIIFHVKSSRYR